MPAPWTFRPGLLSEHDFRQLFMSTSVSHVGLQITQLAIPLVAITAVDASESEVGTLIALATVATLLIGLPAGAWVDRLRKRHVLITSDLARAMVLASVPLAWWAGALTLWQLYAVVLVYGFLTVFFDVAYHSYLPQLVGRERLVEANAKLESLRSLSQVGGPALAGLLIRLLSAPVVLLVDAIAMALSAGLVARIRQPEVRPTRRTQQTILQQIGEGLTFVLSNRLLRAIAASAAVFNLFFMMYMSMLTFFLARELDQSAATIGVVFSFGGVGGLLGALFARRLSGRVGPGKALWVSLCGTPFALLMPLAQGELAVWLGAVGWLVYWAGIVVYNVTQLSLRQSMTPDHLLGRMNATVRFVVWGVLPLGAFLGGLLGSWLGARGTLVIAALGSTLAVLPILCSPLRSLRHAPKPAQDPQAVTAPPNRNPDPDRQNRAGQGDRQFATNPEKRSSNPASGGDR